MSMFLTRVELHLADSSDYDNLHKYMERAGFSRTVISSDNVTYQLPTAEYYYNNDVSTETVKALALDAASLTKRVPMVVTIKSDGPILVHNLKRV